MRCNMSCQAIGTVLLVLGLGRPVAVAEIREEAIGGEVEDEFANHIQPTDDGGFIVTGIFAEREDQTGAGLYDDVLLLKLDRQGREVWSRSFGILGREAGHAVRQTLDGGFIIAGDRYGGLTRGDDLYLIRTDASGEEIWSRIYGDVFTNQGRSVIQTADGGFVIAGTTVTPSGGLRTYDAYLLKVDAQGDEIWLRTFGTDTDNEYGRSAEATGDGGFILVGDTRPWGEGASDVYLVRTGADGHEIWSAQFGFDGEFDNGYSVKQTSDGGFIVGGSTGSFDDRDVYLLRTDGAGGELWSNTFNGLFWDEGKSVQETATGGFIVAGDTWTAPIPYGHREALLVRTDAAGNAAWSRTFGGSAWEVGNSVLQTADEAFLVAGATRSFGESAGADVYLLYFNPVTPTPDIRANGYSGEITLRQGDALALTVALDPGEQPGEEAVWWVAAETPAGPYSYQLAGRSWVPGLTPAHRGPLLTLPESTVFEGSTLPPGAYEIRFAVDLSRDGTIEDGLYIDEVGVEIEP